MVVRTAGNNTITPILQLAGQGKSISNYLLLIILKLKVKGKLKSYGLGSNYVH